MTLEYEARLLSRGRLTVPKAVRDLLGLEPGNTVRFVITDGRAELVPVTDIVARICGIFPSPPGIVTEDFDDLIDEAMSDHADRVVARMRRGEE